MFFENLLIRKMARPSQPFDFGFSLNEEDPGFIHLDHSQGIEVDNHNPQEPGPIGGVEASCSASTTKKKRKTRLTDHVLSYFVKVQVPSPTGGIEEKAECKICKNLLSAKSANGTGHLKRHMDKCVPKTTNTVGVRGGLIQTHRFI